MADVAALRARRAQLIEQIALAEAARSSAAAAAKRAASNAQFATDPTAKSRYESQAERARGEEALQAARLQTLRSQLGELDRQLSTATERNASQEVSAQEVAAAQAARDDGAVIQTPAPANNNYTVTATNPSIEAERPVEQTEFETPVVNSTGRSQAAAAAAGEDVPGVTPRNFDDENQDRDDSYQPQAADAPPPSNGTVPREFLERIIPRPNVLSSLASYTYNISWYILGPQDFKTLMLSQQKQVPGGLLLMRSGGAPAAAGESVRGGQTQINQSVDPGGRNQFFPVDFYMDNFAFQQAITGKSTGSVHNVNNFEFTVYEPYGISLIDRLKAAVTAYADPSLSPQGNATEIKDTPNQSAAESARLARQSAAAGNTDKGNGQKSKVNINYAAQHYLLVIRFYGYDDNGNLVRASGFNGGINDNSDPNAIIEKYIPFRLNELKFRIKNKTVEYQIKAAAVPTSVGTSSVHAVIPYNIELSADTVKNLFLGPTTYNQNSSGGSAAATPTATDTGSRTSSTAPGSTLAAEFGGVDALGNATGANATDPEAQVFVDSYNTSQSSSQKAPPKANTAPKKSVVTGLISALNEFQQTERKKQGFIPDIYEIEFTSPAISDAKLRRPGTLNKKDVPMIQGSAADQYLGSKARVTKDNKNWSVTAGTSIIQFIDLVLRSSSYITDQQLFIYDKEKDKIVPNSNTAGTVQWYKIVSEITPLQYDSKRNDYAYKIKFIVKPYQINDLKSEYFPRARFRGTHKRYDYWFTGQNTEVLDYEANFDKLYFVALTGAPAAYGPDTTNARELEFRYFTPKSDESEQGNQGDDAAANASSVLLSPGDQGNVKFTILGDPDWFMQSEVFLNPRSNNSFQSDGSVNNDAGEVLFEITFNTVTDYDEWSGVMPVTQNNYQGLFSSTPSGDAKNSYVYRANLCTSRFAKGKFTQDIQGSLMTFPNEEMINQQKTAVKSQSEAAGKENATNQQRKPTTQSVVPPSSPNSPTTTPNGARSDAPGSLFAAELGLSEITAGVSYGADDNAVTNPTVTAPTSSGAIVAQPGSSNNAQSGGVNTQPVSAQVFLKSGGVVTVTDQQQIANLFAQGRITAQEKNTANSALQLKLRAQQAQTGTSQQKIARDA